MCKPFRKRFTTTLIHIITSRIIFHRCHFHLPAGPAAVDLAAMELVVVPAAVDLAAMGLVVDPVAGVLVVGTTEFTRRLPAHRVD